MDLLETTEPRAMCWGPSRFFLGLVVFMVATSYLADRLDWTGLHLHVTVWPWILVLLGLAKMNERRASGPPGMSRSGAWLLFVGFWGLVNEYRMFDVSYRRTWPVLLIAAGVLMVLRSQDPVTNDSPSGGRQS